MSNDRNDDSGWVNIYAFLPTVIRCLEEIEKINKSAANKNSKKIKRKQVRRRIRELSGG